MEPLKGMKPLKGEFKLIPKGRALDRTLSDRAYRVLGILGEFLNTETWNCFPAQERMSKLSGKSIAYIYRGIVELKERGFIVIKKGRRENATYEIIWKPQPKPPIQDSSNLQGLKPQDSSNLQGKTRQICETYYMDERDSFIDTKDKALVKEKVSFPDVGGSWELEEREKEMELYSPPNLPELNDDDAPPERDDDSLELDDVSLGFSHSVSCGAVFDADSKKADDSKPSPTPFKPKASQPKPTMGWGGAPIDERLPEKPPF